MLYDIQMSRQRDTVYIPRPSKAVYELGLELTESAHIPDQFQGFHRNGVHALAVSLGEDFGKVRAIAEAPPYRRYDEMEYMRKRAGIERSDLQLAGESLIALSRDRQEILSVLDIIEPGLLLSSGYSTFDTVVKMVVTASYTELCAAETTR